MHIWHRGRDTPNPPGWRTLLQGQFGTLIATVGGCEAAKRLLKETGAEWAGLNSGKMDLEPDTINTKKIEHLEVEGVFSTLSE